MAERWVVTLAEGAEVGEAVPRLAGAGLEVDQVLDSIGVVTGRCGEATARALRGLTGVEDVSPEDQASVPPPESDLW